MCSLGPWLYCGITAEIHSKIFRNLKVDFWAPRKRSGGAIAPLALPVSTALLNALSLVHDFCTVDWQKTVFFKKLQ